MTRDIRIRPAIAADAETLARILANAWRETYGGILPEELVAKRADPDQQLTWWREQLADPATASGTWLGELDGEPAGLALARATPEDAPRPLELKLCYTFAASHGSGLSHALIEAAIGDRPAWLWMLHGNDRAEAFYRKHGFHREEPWDTREWGEAFGATRYTDIRLVR
ncbi:GNAT family N-acetyltransferase [Gulosibacter molinativorax]|uniref:GNAT family N-acetyltransferase n=1 Tax=Gulosibacter molinativorax TaxID=256821 RepID=UPI0004262079|nr:GNAT family N-acetyltransferase [Gulosibacter molinativorax]QUY63225.1 Hypotetical protein [Gulosibacter molinativorax]